MKRSSIFSGSRAQGSPGTYPPRAWRGAIFLAAALIAGFSATSPGRLLAGPGQEKQRDRQKQENREKKKETGTKTEETARAQEERKTAEPKDPRHEDAVRARDREAQEEAVRARDRETTEEAARARDREARGAKDSAGGDRRARGDERRDVDRRIHKRFPDQVREKRREEPGGGPANIVIRPPRVPKPVKPPVDAPPVVTPWVPPEVVPIPPRPPWDPYPEIIVIEHWYYEDDYGYDDDPLPDYIFDDYSGNEQFVIRLPFGSIVPWEVGELFLMKLKDIESEGYGNSLIVCIIQTQDEMPYRDFLDRYRWDADEFEYYDTLSGRSFLLSAPVSSVLRLLKDPSIRWIGEYRPDYKIVPGPRNATLFVSSFGGDRMEFRRDLNGLDLDVASYDEKSGEYLVRADYDCYYDIADLWWVESVSSEPRVAAGLYGAGLSGR